ncbi:MAG: hypothetical protein ACTH31_11735, partial [Pseudoclavibacter sp.]
WNGGSTVAGNLAETSAQMLGNTALLFFLVMVPIFVGWIIMVVRFRAGDRKLLRERLGEYASVGWYSPAEVDMLTNMRGRSGARAWAKQFGPTAVRAMRTLLEESTRLARVRTRLMNSPTNAGLQTEEGELLRDITQIRRVLDRSQHAGATQMRQVAAVAPPANAPYGMPQPVWPTAPQHPAGQPQPQAGPGPYGQGMQPQGVQPQGMQPQGMPPQGVPPQGMQPQGMPPLGGQPSAAAPGQQQAPAPSPYGPRPTGAPGTGEAPGDSLGRWHPPGQP